MIFTLIWEGYKKYLFPVTVSSSVLIYSVTVSSST